MRSNQNQLNAIQNKYINLILKGVVREEESKNSEIDDIKITKENAQNIFKSQQSDQIKELKECLICHLELFDEDNEIRQKRINEVKSQTTSNSQGLGQSSPKNNQSRRQKSKNRNAFRFKQKVPGQGTSSEKDLEESSLNEYVANVQRYKLECGHDDYHKKCIMDWLKIHARCPACNQDIDMKDK